jgi:hypothetical protein
MKIDQKNNQYIEGVSNVKVYAVDKICAETQVGPWATFTKKDYINKSAGINTIIANCTPVFCTTNSQGSCNLNITNNNAYVSFATNGPAGTPFINGYNRAIYRDEFTLDDDMIEYQRLKSYGCKNQATVTLYSA